MASFCCCCFWWGLWPAKNNCKPLGQNPLVSTTTITTHICSYIYYIFTSLFFRSEKKAASLTGTLWCWLSSTFQYLCRNKYLCFSLSGHFPCGPCLAGTRMSTFWIVLKQDDGGDGNSWSCKTCKAPARLLPSRNQHPVSSFTDWMPFLSLNQPCRNTEGKSNVEISICRIKVWHRWLGDRKGIWPVKKLDVGLLVVMIWLELCTTYSSSSPVVSTTSIIRCFNKINAG